MNLKSLFQRPTLDSQALRLVVGIFSGFAGVGCMGTPSPLAPSLSGTIGVPHNGVLTHSAELPRTGQGYRRFRPHAPIYFALPRLVRAIERAAKVVDTQMPGGAPLIVGDLSAQSGGKIPRHNSHRSGRDVDFLFYLTTPSGISIRNPGFIPLKEDGFVRFPEKTYARLDVERQWLLFKTLLQDEEIDIQFLFMSRDLEARVMNYAISKESDLALLWHAQTVMLQPGDSLPHADHVHVRISCTPEESVSGCTGGGPRWPWLEKFPELDLPLDELLAQIKQEDPFELAPLPPRGSPLDATENYSANSAASSEARGLPRLSIEPTPG